MDQELIRTNQIKTQKALNFTKRQTVMSGRSGRRYADFLEVSSGLNVVAKASNQEPIIFTTANGFDNNGPVDYINIVRNDVNFNNLVPNATNYLGFERVDQDTVNPIITTTRPEYGYFFTSDNEDKICATFDGPLNSTTFVDFYGNVFNMYDGASIQTGHPSGSGNSLRQNSSTGRAEINLHRSKFNFFKLRNWTIEFWLKFDSVVRTSQQFIISAKSIDFAFDFLKQPNNNNQFALRIGDFHPEVTFTTNPLNDNTWYKFVIVRSETKIRVYVNNILYHSSSYNQTTSNYQQSNFPIFNLGNHANLNLPMIGNISNFAIWPYAKYYPQNGGNTLGTTTLSPSSTNTSNLVKDQTIEDRNFVINDRFHIDLANEPVGQISFKEIYGNNVVFKSHGTTGICYVEEILGPFGTNVKTIKTDGTPFNHFEIQNVKFADTWTLETWVRKTNSGNFASIFDTHFYSVNSVALYCRFSPTNTIHFGISSNIDGPPLNSFVSSTTYSNGVWHHIAISYDGFTYRLFANGQLLHSFNSLLKIENLYKIMFGGIEMNVNSYQPLQGNFFGTTLTPYCKYTTNFTVPNSLDSFKEQIYIYDIRRAKMYKGYYRNWSVVPTIFLGEAKTNNNSINYLITYSLNGECFIDNFASDWGGEDSSGYNIKYSAIPHFIGTDKVKIDYNYYINQPIGNLYDMFLARTKIKPMAYDNDTYGFAHESNPITIIDHNYFGLIKGTNDFVFFGPNGNAFGLDLLNNFQNKFEFKIERDF